MRTVKFATLVILASATLFACKPKEKAPALAAGEVTEEAARENAAPAAAVDRREALQSHRDAPENADLTTYWEPSGGGGSSAKSVHWANDTEKAALASNYLANPLEITCSSSESPGVSITLSAPNATESDVPMAPGSYPIRGREQPAVKGAQFAMTSLSFNGRDFDSTQRHHHHCGIHHARRAGFVHARRRADECGRRRTDPPSGYVRDSLPRRHDGRRVHGQAGLATGAITRIAAAPDGVSAAAERCLNTPHAALAPPIPRDHRARRRRPAGVVRVAGARARGG